jgi:hypothetical protein
LRRRLNHPTTLPSDPILPFSHPAFACISKDFQRNCDQEGCYHGILDQCSFPASLSFEFRLSSQLLQHTCHKFILAQYTPVVSHVSMANASTAEIVDLKRWRSQLGGGAGKVFANFTHH